MILDRELLLSSAQAITADAASTNIVDLGAGGLDRGPGAGVVVAVRIAASFNTLTSLTFQLQCDADVAFGSPRILTQLNVALADLVLNRRFTLPVPRERLERYLRVYYDVVGSNPTLGQVTAWLTDADSIAAGLSA